MVDIHDIELYDRIKIVDEFDHHCKEYGLNPSMRKYLGEVVTVIERRLFDDDNLHTYLERPNRHFVRIDEDGGMFQWNRWMIDHIVRDEMKDAEIQNEDFSAVLKWGTIE